MKSIYPIMVATAASTATVSVVTFETMTPTEKIQTLTQAIEEKSADLEKKERELTDKKDKNQRELKAVEDTKTRLWFAELTREMRAKTINRGDHMEIVRPIEPRPYANVRKQLTIDLYKLERYAIN